jgi:hypothetical protein
MSSKSQRPTVDHVDHGEQEGQDQSADSEQDSQQAVLPSTVQRGGGTHIVQPGETLGRISTATYGSSAFWSQIATANPDGVGLGGDIIYTGSELTLPVLAVPTEGAPPAVDDSKPAQEPREELSEYGDFLVYDNGFVGPLPEDEFLIVMRESAYEEELTRRVLAAEENKEQAIGSIQDLITTSGLSVITDSEAILAMELLAALPLPQRMAAVQSIGTERVDLLLANVPSSAIGTGNFTAVVVALGPAAVQRQITQLFAPSFFDLAEDRELLMVAAIVSWLPEATQFQVFENCGAASVSRLLSLLPSGSQLSEDQKFLLSAIFDWAGDSNQALLEAAFEKRWDVSVSALQGTSSTKAGIEWEAQGLRRSWAIFQGLPPGHVEGNPNLDAYVRYVSVRDDGSTRKANGAGGYYQGSTDLVALNYNEETLDSANGAGEEGDPLLGVNRFSKVVRHEIGHAVDAKLGIKNGYCTTSDGGGWKDHTGDAGTIAAAWLNHLDGPLSDFTGSSRDVVEQDLVRSIEQGSAGAFQTSLLSEDIWDKLEGEPADIVAADPIYKALQMALNNPWYQHLSENGGAAADGRVYQRSYSRSEQWTSYEVAARDKKVSTYQFRAAGEWFAEVYATFYESDQDNDGDLLRTRDPDTWAWFCDNVADK